jgi:carbon-monoxide dehydrogenase large subunit
MTLAEISGMAHVRPELLPEDMSPGLDETSFYDPNNFVFPFGAHACVVDVELDTGKVKVVRYVAVDDCGPAINPMLIDGQVHGGIAQAIGQALYEHIEYDEEGQLVTGTFVDYACPPRPRCRCSRRTARRRRPRSTRSGSRASARRARSPRARVTNAVIDALRPHGVTYLNMPLTSERVWRAIEEATS